LLYARAEYQVWSLAKAAKSKDGTFSAPHINFVALSDDRVFYATERQEVHSLALGPTGSNASPLLVSHGIKCMAYTAAGLLIIDGRYHVLQADWVKNALQDRGAMPVSGAAKVVIAADGKHAAVWSGGRGMGWDRFV